MFATLPSWREPDAIRRLARIAVAVRPGNAKPKRAAGKRHGRRVTWLENAGLEISSSDVRARARTGRSLRYLVSDAVARYVAAHGLYR
jgi:nicotinate-nucleotide adenylyltransferase